MATPKTNRPGKVLAQVAGLRVRLTPAGEFGIYAGKHLFKSYLLVDSAIKDAKRITQAKPTYYSLVQAFKEWKNKRK